ncbi:mCG1042840, partial [Mus musculus]
WHLGLKGDATADGVLIGKQSVCWLLGPLGWLLLLPYLQSGDGDEIQGLSRYANEASFLNSNCGIALKNLF